MLNNSASSRRRRHFSDLYNGWIIVPEALVSMAFWLDIRYSHNRCLIGVPYLYLAGGPPEVSPFWIA
jgi:hypothetical protein